MRHILILLVVLMSGCSTLINIFDEAPASPSEFAEYTKNVYRKTTPSAVWNSTETGEIRGAIILKWYGPDKFVFIYNESDPLTFIRKSNGQEIDRITPGENFYTDGGSIPKFLQGSKSFSALNFMPAYIVHDWLF